MLELEGIDAGYASAAVLHGVDLSVGANEVVAILGRNGMGKTSLIRTICGLRPPRRTAGSIRFGGSDIAGLEPYRIARAGIGLVPQGRRVFASLSVDENLRIAARPGSWDVPAVQELFPRLRERAGQRAGTLSGGEQQMLAIGRALMTNPRLLVMDEPSEGLAPVVVQDVAARIQVLRERGLSVLLAEQNVDLALGVADRVVVLGDGGVVTWTGLPATLQADEVLIAQLVGL